jgi:hypothetical protein
VTGPSTLPSRERGLDNSLCGLVPSAGTVASGQDQLEDSLPLPDSQKACYHLGTGERLQPVQWAREGGCPSRVVSSRKAVTMTSYVTGVTVLPGR